MRLSLSASAPPIIGLRLQVLYSPTRSGRKQASRAPPRMQPSSRSESGSAAKSDGHRGGRLGISVAAGLFVRLYRSFNAFRSASRGGHRCRNREQRPRPAISAVTKRYRSHEGSRTARTEPDFPARCGQDALLSRACLPSMLLYNLESPRWSRPALAHAAAIAQTVEQPASADP
jgi:hypothetical protein